MLRPRRTSELQEEPGTATKRQSKISSVRFTHSVGVTPIAALKYSGRQSATGSATRGRTPQKTPVRALFSTDKKRNTAGGNSHNDKKWVQEQLVRITEHLKDAYYKHKLTGINEDFITRPNCLKNMSIKQFVSIINYFLQFIVGNRFTVGSNHVEDIVNILQNIHYPHPVNKSWLKTPTTMHSFQNVVVLFDFFMNFVPISDSEFELEELQDNTAQNKEFEPDLEFKSFLLKNCQESFQLWDQNMNEEFEKMKRQTADLLVQKQGFDGLESIEEEVKKLQTSYEEIKSKRREIDPKDEYKCKELRELVKAARNELDQLIDNYDQISQSLDEMGMKKKKLSDEVAELEPQIAALQMSIKKQACSVKERDEYVEKIKLLRVEMESNTRTMRDLQTRDHNKKIELSVIKQKVTDEIEHFNSLLRDLIEIQGITNAQNHMQISFNANPEEVQRLVPELKTQRIEIESKLLKAKEELRKYDEEIKKYKYRKSTAIEPELEMKNKSLAKILNSMESFERHAIEESKIMFTKKQELDEQLHNYEMETEDLKKQLEEKKKELQKLEQENENTLSEAEEEQKLWAAAQKMRLEAWRNDLKDCLNVLDELNQTLNDDDDESVAIVDKEKENVAQRSKDQEAIPI